jgi:hypothetical protein
LSAKKYIAVLLLLGLVVRVFGILQTNQTSILGMPLTDDSYYYFSLGRNLATQGEMRVDSFHLTTGFQPLWGFFCVIPYFLLGPDTSTPISVIQSAGAVLGLATAIVLFLLTYHLSNAVNPSLLVLSFWLLSPQVIKHNLNGMETSLANFTVATTFYLFLRREVLLRRISSYWLAGACAALAFLARVDAAILFLAIAVVTIGRHKREGRFFPVHISKVRKQLVALGGGALIVLFPWIVLVIIVGKPFIPESGAAVRTLSLLTHGFQSPNIIDVLANEPLRYAGYMADNFIKFTSSWSRQVPFLLPPAMLLTFLFDEEVARTLVAVFAVGTGIVVAFSFWKYSNEKQREFALCFVLYLVVMTLSYSAIQGGAWFYDRYGTSITALGLIALCIAGENLHRVTRNALTSTLGSIYILVTFCSLLALLYTPGYRWLVAQPPEDGLYRAAVWINQNTKSTELVGAFQSGVIAYTLRNPLINLDGKVNADALEALRDKSLCSYISQSGIRYIVDWRPQIKSLLGRETDLSQIGGTILSFRSESMHEVVVIKLRLE